MKQENEIDMEINGKDLSNCTNAYLKGCPSPELCASLLENPQVFYKLLSEFHESYGLSFVSSAASAVLDLHLFYKQVTMRGGFAQVTKDGIWYKVASAMNFYNGSPQTSFLLQSLYANLLFQFELIYGSRGQESRSTPQGSHLVSAPIKRIHSEQPSSSIDSRTWKRKHPTSPKQSYTGFDDPGNLVGNKVSGVIETEIECGYLISVTLGTEKLNGLLYHSKDSSVQQFATIPSLMDGVGLEDSDSEPVGLQVLVKSNKEHNTILSSKDENETKPKSGSSSKAESKIKPTVKSTAKKERKDQEAPRATRSAYQFFLCKECDRLKKVHGKNAKIRQMVIDAWRCLPENDKLPYMEESRKDRERFKREMSAYNERKAIESNKGEFRIFNSEASMHEFHQLEEADKLFRHDGPMVGFNSEVMENVLDAAMKIELPDDFLSLS